MSWWEDNPIRLLDQWESSGERRLHIGLGVVGALGTILIWIYWRSHFHIRDLTNLFPNLTPIQIRIPFVSVIFLLTPPYLAAFGFAHALMPPAPPSSLTGPMSGYMQQDESSRKWKIRVGAGVFAVANLWAMVFGVGPG